ncbi:MAG: polysaccharide deacetylase family protein [Armatimonadetes bacterium]|nr:polysaccharide deacetylase family protein [Armatimonadota bacterium]
MIKGQWRRGAGWGAAALALLAGAVRGDAAQPYAAQTGYALHLIEGTRYAEAADAAQGLVNDAPNAAPSYQVRGTLALYVGDVARAQRDFQIAATHAPSEPATEYGLGLCALFGRRWDEARADFEAARKAPGLTPAQVVDADTARAYAEYLRGNRAEARTLATPAGDDPVRQETLAMIAAQDRPDEGSALLKTFLGTPSGAPRVREDEGVRGLFEPSAAVEPSVTERPLQRLYATRLAERMEDAERGQGRTQTLSGTVTLTARTIGLDGTAVVTFSVDGQVAAIVNSTPYVCAWDTTQAVNGRHTIQIEADDAHGRALTTETRTVRVRNARSRSVDDGHGGLTDADYADVQGRLWALLRLRPARKAAEWALAERLAAQGDEAGADAHRLVTAALDPDYKGGRHVARLLLGGAARRIALVPKPIPLASAPPLGLWRGDPARREVALTFDDGPNPQKTPALLDALDKAHVLATFFVVGARAEAAPDLLRRMAQRGDDVENHSYTHPDLDQAEPVVVEEELLRANVVIQALTGRMPRFFRPPGGDGGPSVLKLAQAYGLTGAFWTLDALHYEEAAASDALVHYVASHVQPGSIVLMHNGPDATIKAIPQLAAALRAQGYQIVTLAQMARGGVPAQAPPGAKPGKE